MRIVFFLTFALSFTWAEHGLHTCGDIGQLYNENNCLSKSPIFELPRKGPSTGLVPTCEGVRDFYVKNQCCADYPSKPLSDTVDLINWCYTDTVHPVLTVLGDASIRLTMDVNAGSYVDAGATCSDNCADNLNHKVEVSGAVVDLTKAGIYVVNYNCRDNAGNSATQVSRTVIVDAILPVEDFLYTGSGGYGFNSTTPLTGIVFDNSKVHTDRQFYPFTHKPAESDWSSYCGFKLSVRVSTNNDPSTVSGSYGSLTYQQLSRIEAQNPGTYPGALQGIWGAEVGYYNDAHKTSYTSPAQLPSLPPLSENVEIWARGIYRLYINLENSDNGDVSRSLQIELIDVTKGNTTIPGTDVRIPETTYDFDFAFDNIVDPKLCNEDLINYDKYGYNGGSTRYTTVLAEDVVAGQDYIILSGLPPNMSGMELVTLQATTYAFGRDITTVTEYEHCLKSPKSSGRAPAEGEAMGAGAAAIEQAEAGTYKIHLKNHAAHKPSCPMPAGTAITLWAHPPRRYQGPNCYVNKLGANQREGYGVTAPRNNVTGLSIAPYMRDGRWIGTNEVITIDVSDVELYHC